MSELILLLLWIKTKGFKCSLPVNVCKNTFCFTFFIIFHNLFSQGHRFTHITYTGSICNHSLKCGCHFSTLDINAHFRILYLLQNSNCIRRFIRLNECSNSTKFVWVLLDNQVYFYRRLFDTLKLQGCVLWPLWPLIGINNKRAFGAKLILTAGLAIL